jgi:hypothetical protein
VDPVASTAAGAVITSDMWWAGNTVAIPNPIGSQTGNSLTGGACEDTVGDNGAEVIDCDATIVGNPIFTQGVVFCEFDNTTLEPPQAGYGGRCSSAKQQGIPGSAPAFGDWIEMTVVSGHPDFMAGSPPAPAPQDATCNPAWTDGAKFFARIGNNVHGLEVDRGESFFYRDLLAYWISSGHATYFLDVVDAQEDTQPGDLLGCFGVDSHTADTTIATNVDALCNSTDPDAGVDEFDRSTYIVGAPQGEQTVCTA